MSDMIVCIINPNGYACPQPDDAAYANADPNAPFQPDPIYTTLAIGEEVNPPLVY